MLGQSMSIYNSVVLCITLRESKRGRERKWERKMMTRAAILYFDMKTSQVCKQQLWVFLCVSLCVYVQAMRVLRINLSVHTHTHAVTVSNHKYYSEFKKCGKAGVRVRSHIPLTWWEICRNKNIKKPRTCSAITHFECQSRSTHDATDVYSCLCCRMSRFVSVFTV